jgi:hypothetical protein
MTFLQTGGCLCGAVRYEITQAPGMVYTCHCTHCQRATGGAFSIGVVVADEAFFVAGSELKPVKRTADSGRVATTWVCPECGTWLGGGGKKPREPAVGGFRTVRGGTLDDTSWLQPTVHFWTRSAQTWFALPQGGRRFETQPTHWFDLFAQSVNPSAPSDLPK